MKAIFVCFDTLNRHLLPPYGGDWVHAPNFSRLAERSVTFDNAYVGSMPCIPARRELHTGRYNFLHRSWGPLEPFDESMPEILTQYSGPHLDSPDYARVSESPEQVEHLRYEYAALVSMCDHYLGQVLDTMDELALWDDSLLIVGTDHGFLLGEHDWWAKTVQPWYN